MRYSDTQHYTVVYVRQWAAAVRLMSSRLREEQQQLRRAESCGDGGLALSAYSWLFLVAVRNLLRVVELAEDKFGRHAAEIQAARDGFLQTVPRIKDARDVLEHLDDYTRGRGDLAVKGRPSPPFLTGGFDADNVQIDVGIDNIVIDTAPTAAAANEMADRVLDLIWPAEFR
jgi:hypothetical protein